MFHVELAPLGGILGPLKSDLGVFWAKIPLYPYNVKTQKTHFLKTLSWADFDLLESNSIYIFVHENQKNYHGQFFSLDACLSPMCRINIFLNLLSQVLKIKQSKACFCMIASFFNLLCNILNIRQGRCCQIDIFFYGSQ